MLLEGSAALLVSHLTSSVGDFRREIYHSVPTVVERAAWRSPGAQPRP